MFSIGTTKVNVAKRRKVNELSEKLTMRIKEFACEYGRYGYLRITALLKNEGWRVNHKRVEQIWRLEGLKVPKRQPRRRRLWFNDGSCVRLRPEYKNHVWSYDFVADLIREWLKDLGVTTAFIEPGSPWENGCIESFNGKFRDELLNGEIFDTIYETQVVTEKWRRHYNTLLPHSALGYRPPAPETIILYQVGNA